MKKAGLFLVFIFCVFILSGCGPKKPSGGENISGVPEAKTTPFPTKPVEETIKIRPYVTLIASSDVHWLTLGIKNIPKGTASLEYEIIYFAEAEGNRIERGVGTAGKPLELNSETEFSKKFLLGSASCTTGTCKYKYDENVNEGTLTIKLGSSSGTEKYEAVFRIQKGKEAKEGLTTGDGVFTLVADSLPANSIFLTISTVGVLVALPEGVVPKSIPYGIFSSSLKKSTVSFKTDLSSCSIYAFDGKSWSKLVTEVSQGEAKASSSNQNTFILAE